MSAYIARAYLPALPTLSVLHSSEQVTVSWPTVDTARFTHPSAASISLHASAPVLVPDRHSYNSGNEKLKYSRYFPRKNVL